MSRANTSISSGGKQNARNGPAKPVPGPTSPAARPVPSQDEIRRRAYAVYQARLAKGLPGTPESDWMQAERELRA